jgi:hypothetical protein
MQSQGLSNSGNSTQGQSIGNSGNASQGQLQGISLGGGGTGSGLGNNNSTTNAAPADLSKAIGNSYAPALTTTLTETSTT